MAYFVPYPLLPTQSLQIEGLGYVRNLRVRFRISDVYIPEPEEVLNELYGNSLLQGEVMDFTDAGPRQHRYIVVKVKDVKGSLIVPVEKVVVLKSDE